MPDPADAELSTLADVDLSKYTKDYWRRNIRQYLREVWGMNENEIDKHFALYFPEL